MIKNFYAVGIAAALAGTLLAANLNGEATMSKQEQHKALARRVTEMYDRDSNIADEIFHPDCLHHVNGSAEKLTGPAAIKQAILQTREAFDSSRTVIDAMLAENDLLAFRWTWVAKIRGSQLDYTLHGNTVFRFADGKVIEAWAIDDRLREMEKLGYTLTPPSAEIK